MTCIIVDDEPLAVKLLESFVARTPQLELKGAYTDSVEAIAALREQPVDLIFLDIQMPDMDGLELAHMLPKETMIISVMRIRWCVLILWWVWRERSSSVCR